MKYPKQSKTILVVDDEKTIREFVGALLERRGYTVLLASNSTEALQKSKAHDGPIHLLLSNVQMPGTTGMELGTQIQQERPDTRVMLMSGFASGLLVLNEGWHFLHKPFVPGQLVALIAHVLNDPTVPSAGGWDEHQK